MSWLMLGRGVNGKIAAPRELLRCASFSKQTLDRATVVSSSGSQCEDATIASGQRLVSVVPSKAQGNPAFEAPKGTTIRGFSDLKISDEMISALELLKIYQPTAIQMAVIPFILGGHNVLSASQTGSGKTVSYLAPIIQMLKKSEKEGLLRRHNHPRACIVLPSRELAAQTLRVVKTLCHRVPLRSAGMIGGINESRIRMSFKEPVDIVVATTGTLMKYKKRGWITFSDLKFLVLDEIDTLLDPSFRESTYQLINSLRLGDVYRPVTSEEARCVLAGATVPSSGVLDVITELIPRVKVCSASLHKILPHVNHRFEKTTTTEKEVLFRQLLKTKAGPSRTRKCIVFTNSAVTCAWLNRLLEENGFQTGCLHGNMSVEERATVFQHFQDGEQNILVTTDVASRGLDTPKVGLVVNYDCPSNETDYLHRAGRTGRAQVDHTGTPTVCTYVTKNKEAMLAKKIQNAASKNQSLDGIHLKGERRPTLRLPQRPPRRDLQQQDVRHPQRHNAIASRTKPHNK